jgi:hypothetical protein
MLAEIVVTPELIIAGIGILCTLVTTGIAVWNHVKAGNWEAVAEEISKATDKLKNKIPAKKRKSILKDLGVRLGDKRKGLLDDKLKSLGLDSKS